MKIKMETQKDGIVILSITEEVLAKDIPVLKAGLLKLIQSGQKSIVLDLTGIGQFDLNAIKEFASLEFIEPELEAQVVIASLMKGIGTADAKEDAIKMIGSPLALLLATESRLQGKLQKLTKTKTALEAKLNSFGGDQGVNDIRALRKLNSDLKTNILRLERQLRKLMKTRLEPIAARLEEKQIEMLGRTINVVLEKEGVLSSK